MARIFQVWRGALLKCVSRIWYQFMAIDHFLEKCISRYGTYRNLPAIIGSMARCIRLCSSLLIQCRTFSLFKFQWKRSIMLNNGFILSDVLVLPLLYCFIKNMEWGGGISSKREWLRFNFVGFWWGGGGGVGGRVDVGKFSWRYIL